MTKFHDLFELGQSPWLDNLRRDWLTDGTLQRWVDRGIRGVTSNPTIFQKAMTGGDAYDAQLAELLAGGASVDDAYWAMVRTDIDDALRVLRPVHDAAGGADGFVSLELAPDLAHDTAGSIEAARRLHEDIAAPNLMVKIPGTAAGVPAVQAMVAEGRNINVTLIFGLPRYDEVMEAYLAGLEAIDGDLSHVHGVASFFVSRVDTEVDRRLDAIGTPEARALRGKAAVAQARLAYRAFRRTFSGPRWEALAARGANVQRPLWASTSTKDPSYSPTLYVDTLIGPDTVNTMPENTLDAFEATGTVARTVDAPTGPDDDPERVFERLDALGIDMDDVARVLEEQGVASFAASFDDLRASLEDRAASLTRG